VGAPRGIPFQSRTEFPSQLWRKPYWGAFGIRPSVKEEPRYGFKATGKDLRSNRAFDPRAQPTAAVKAANSPCQPPFFPWTRVSHLISRSPFQPHEAHVIPVTLQRNFVCAWIRKYARRTLKSPPLSNSIFRTTSNETEVNFISSITSDLETPEPNVASHIPCSPRFHAARYLNNRLCSLSEPMQLHSRALIMQI
jgi:hypothetical protein